MGAAHGAWCVGCCWALMASLLALGVMSVAWMAAIAIVIFVQKVLPLGDRLAPVVAAALVALATWVVVSA
jgi:predicted metal-binding membrane protein